MGARSPAPRAVELVHADGSTQRLRVREDESVLEAAERRGIALPFGCRRGACATCTGRLLEGSVEHRRPPRALKPRHREEGYVLTCVARPRSDCRLRVGADVTAELTTNPFR